MAINKTFLSGNLTADPEVVTFTSGNKVTKFGIAVNRYSKSEKLVSFFDCVAYDNTGENIAKWFWKGRPILIEGKLQQDRWVDREDNKNKSRVKVIVDKFEFMNYEKGDDREAVEQTEPAEVEVTGDVNEMREW